LLAQPELVAVFRPKVGWNIELPQRKGQSNRARDLATKGYLLHSDADAECGQRE